MTDSIEEMLRTAETLARATGHSFGGTNTSVIKFGGGGYGVLICVMAAVIALVMLVNNNGDIDSMERHTADALEQVRQEAATSKAETSQELKALADRLETQQAYLNAIYQQSGKSK